MIAAVFATAVALAGQVDLASKSIAVLKTEVGGDIDAAVGPQITSRVSEALRTRTQAKVISADEIVAILQNEKQKAILGTCSNDQCLAELASALGAEIVVGTKLAKVQDQLALTMTMLDGSSANVLARASETWGGDPLLLLALVQPMVDKMVAQIAGAPVPTGALEVVNALDGSKILVDDAVKGTVPAGQIGNITVGAHRVGLLHDDMKPFEKWVVVTTGEGPVSVAAQQEELDPAFYQTWWFWTASGAAVLVAGAAVAGVAVYGLSQGANAGETGVNVSVNADKKLEGSR